MRSPVDLPPVASNCRLYIEGPFGTGKTDLGLARLSWAMQEVRGHGEVVTLLVPSRYSLRRLRQRLENRGPSTQSPYRLVTFAGLMAEAVTLAWPVIAERAGYIEPAPAPRFLNLETAQHLLAPEVRERAIQGQFEAATRYHSPGNNRLLSQLIDNLSKAAMYGYPLEEAYLRLARSVPDSKFKEGRLGALRTALRVSRSFRRNCFRQSLVSFDLLFQLFHLLLGDDRLFHSLLLEPCRHLVAFECEELDYACHRFLTKIIPLTDSSLCLADANGGFRDFLGAYPEGLSRLAEVSDLCLVLTDPPQSGRKVIEQRVKRAIAWEGRQENGSESDGKRIEVVRASPLDLCQGHTQDFLDISHHEHFSDTLAWTAKTAANLIQREGIRPKQVVVLAPVVGNALRFALQQKFQSHGLEIFTHRPSRKLRDEPAIQALLTLTCLAHPHWRLPVDAVAKRIVLQMAMADLEGWHAHTLAQNWNSSFRPFLSYPEEWQERIGNRNGVRFDALRSWLHDYHNEERHEPLDVFLTRLYDELLSSPGFSFGNDADAARTSHQLIRSAYRFREMLDEIGFQENIAGNPFMLQGESGKIYIELVQAGLIGGLHLPDDMPPDHAVVLAPAYNFIMQGYEVEHQFWLDLNHHSWGKRMHQPLTHPYVLEPVWSANRAWSDADEERVGQRKIWKLLVGLLRRTGRRVHVAVSAFGETGHDQKGPLVRALNSMLVQEANSTARLATTPRTS